MPAVDVVVRECVECGASYEPVQNTQKFCSRKCKTASYNKRMCKRLREETLAEKVANPRYCLVCDALIPPTANLKRQFCSRKCTDASYMKRRNEKLLAEKVANPRYCLVCDALIPPTATLQKKFCSNKCKQAAREGTASATGRLRVTVNGVPQSIDRVVIYERDEWVCQLCMEPIDRTLRWPDPMCASIDHVVPVSMGGDNSAENLQASHLRCNVVKGNSTSGSELRPAPTHLGVEYCSANKAAKHLNIQQNRVTRLVHAGVVPAMPREKGGNYRIPVSFVEQAHALGVFAKIK